MASANLAQSELAPSTCRLILIEGIPGSGKSSTAKWICRTLNARGVRAQWFLEERHDHPVINRPTLKLSRQPEFADHCIARWQDFSASLLRDPEAPFQILEGTLFQSTVRPMLEHDHPVAQREHYLEGMRQAVQPLNPNLLYLSHPDPSAYLRNQLVSRKGREIVDKIAAYTETTACAQRHGWHGREGMAEFYTHYREVCDGLVDAVSFPVLRFDTSTGDWNGLHRALSTWLDKLAPNREITPQPWQDSI